MFFLKSLSHSATHRSATLLVGLGNPGDQYAGNRHNVGFMAVGSIATHHQFPAFKKKFSGLLSEGTVAGARVFLLKPLTYMNLSGESVAAAAQFYKIPPERIIVFHDELDLPLAKIRVKQGGGHGGHNGLKSIDAHIGKEYHRVRIGIGHPLRPPKHQATDDDAPQIRVGGGDKNLVSDYVLSDFSKAEKQTVDALLAEISRYIALLLTGGDTTGFMNKLAPVKQDIS
ncbi:MAG: aminoacyl-tRNA hydrolase [Alphaproteobacteria bacterium]|nr:aminoacyl-tRNA hydrolase [Alphaproteobacteria bacterium]